MRWLSPILALWSATALADLPLEIRRTELIGRGPDTKSDGDSVFEPGERFVLRGELVVSGATALHGVELSLRDLPRGIEVTPVTLEFEAIEPGAPIAFRWVIALEKDFRGPRIQSFRAWLKCADQIVEVELIAGKIAVPPKRPPRGALHFAVHVDSTLAEAPAIAASLDAALREAGYRSKLGPLCADRLCVEAARARAKADRILWIHPSADLCEVDVTVFSSLSKKKAPPEGWPAPPTFRVPNELCSAMGVGRKAPRIVSELAAIVETAKR